MAIAKPDAATAPGLALHRKTKSIEELIPWLYLKGISTGGFEEALQALLGPDCPGLSATTIKRLKTS